MATVVIIGGGRGFKIAVRRSNQPNKSKLLLCSRYFYFNIPFKQLCTSCKTEHFSCKGGCGVCWRTRIEVLERRLA